MPVPKTLSRFRLLTPKARTFRDTNPKGFARMPQPNSQSTRLLALTIRTLWQARG